MNRPAESIFYRMWFPLECQLRALHTRAIQFVLAHFASRRFHVTDEPCVVIAPHQDDETFGCGGLIATKRLNNTPVTIVFVTDGAASPAAEPPFSAERLVRLRITEAVNATQALGVDASDLHFLGQPDAGLSTLEPNRRAALVERLAGILRSTGARELFIPHARDRHPDHEATFEIAMDALAVAGTRVRVYQYAVWMTWLNPLLVRLKLSHLRDALSLSIRPVLGKKCGAVGVYASQLAELPPGFVDAFLRPIELFFPVRESAGISRKEGVAA